LPEAAGDQSTTAKALLVGSDHPGDGRCQQDRDLVLVGTVHDRRCQRLFLCKFEGIGWVSEICAGILTICVEEEIKSSSD